MSATPASSSSGDGNPSGTAIPEDDEHEADMPLTMAASVILTSLPKNAQEALEGAGDISQAKVTVRFHAIGSAPQLRQKVFKISSSQRFETIVSFLRKKLGIEASDSVFCYINQVFAPALDEVVGNLWRVVLQNWGRARGGICKDTGFWMKRFNDPYTLTLNAIGLWKADRDSLLPSWAPKSDREVA